MIRKGCVYLSDGILRNSEPQNYNRGRKKVEPALHSRASDTVWDVLSWLAGGMTESEILNDYPELQRDDFRAVYEYAARVGKRVAL